MHRKINNIIQKMYINERKRPIYKENEQHNPKMDKIKENYQYMSKNEQNNLQNVQK